MEELVCAHHLHVADGGRLWSHHLLGSVGLDAGGELAPVLFRTLLWLLIPFVYQIADSMCSSEVFPGDHLDRLLRLSCQGTSVVSFPLVVHADDF